MDELSVVICDDSVITQKKILITYTTMWSRKKYNIKIQTG